MMAGKNVKKNDFNGGWRRKIFKLEPGNSHPVLLSMTFRGSQGLKNLPQVRFRAFAGKAQVQGVSQLGAVETEAQRFISLFFK